MLSDSDTEATNLHKLEDSNRCVNNKWWWLQELKLFCQWRVVCYCRQWHLPLIGNCVTVLSASLSRHSMRSAALNSQLIWGLSGKFPNTSRKNFPVLRWSYSGLSPWTYSPLLCMHRCQHFFNVLKHSWKAFLGMLCKCASEFVLLPQ